MAIITGVLHALVGYICCIHVAGGTVNSDVHKSTAWNVFRVLVIGRNLQRQ